MCCCTVTDGSKLSFYSMPDASDNSWHLFLFLAENTQNKKFVWICEKPSLVASRIRDATNGSPNSVIVKKKFSPSAFLHFCTSRYAFTTAGFYPFVVRGYGPIVMNLWHGMPIKTIGEYKGDESTSSVPFDYFISTSPLFSTVMARAFNTVNERVLPVGLPRNDALVCSNSSAKEKMIAALEIPIGQKIFFWLPTYRQSLARYKHKDSTKATFLDDWDSGLLSRVNDFARDAGVTLIIKVHPADQLNNDARPLEYANLKLLTANDWAAIGVDLYAALAISDGLISDISSVLVDYTITKKPIGVTVGSLSSYSRGLIPEVAGVLDGFHQIRNERDFMLFLECGEEAANLGEEFYKKYNNQALLRGSSARKIVEFLGIR